MSKPTDQPVFRVTLRALPCEFGSVDSRLKRFLKAALRGYSLKCIAIEEIKVPAGKEPKQNEKNTEEA